MTITWEEAGWDKERDREMCINEEVGNGGENIGS